MENTRTFLGRIGFLLLPLQHFNEAAAAGGLSRVPDGDAVLGRCVRLELPQSDFAGSRRQDINDSQYMTDFRIQNRLAELPVGQVTECNQDTEDSPQR